MTKTNRTLVPTPQMPAPAAPALIDDGFIKSRIHTIRGVQVVLDRDLADLFGVATRRLNEQVKRNIRRFPDSFMFRLTKEELEDWRSQIATSNESGHSLANHFSASREDWKSQLVTSKLERYAKMGVRNRPYAFTEHGVVMLASVLRSDVAIEASIQIVNAFVAMRRALASIAPLMDRIVETERLQLAEKTERLADQARNEERFDTIFKAMDGGDFPPQKIFYDGQLWDARAFVNRLVKSARKSLLLVDNFSRMPPRDSVAGGIRRFFASLGPTLLRERGTCSRCPVSSSSSSTGRRGATRRGYSNPARAGGLPPRAMPGFPFRCVAQGPRQEVLRLHEDGRRGNPRAQGETVTPLAASVRVAGCHPATRRSRDGRMLAASRLGTSFLRRSVRDLSSLYGTVGSAWPRRDCSTPV